MRAQCPTIESTEVGNVTAFRDKIAVFYRNSKGAKRKAAEFFLLNPEEAAFLNAEQVAARVGISPSSVTRCVADMGFSGYYEFLDSLRNAVRRGKAPRERLEEHILSDKGSAVAGFRESLANDCGNIEAITSLNSPETVGAAVEALSEAHRIRLFSSRSPYPTLSLFALILSRVRPDVQMISEEGGKLPEQMIELRPDDLFVVANFPRYAKITMDCAEYARGLGCKVIGLTDGPDSPMIPLLDIVLFVPYDSYSFFNSHVASLALYNALATSLSLKKGDESLKRLELHDELVRRFNPLAMQKGEQK